MKLSIERAGGTAGAVPPWESLAEPWRDHEGMIYAYGHVLGSEHWMHLPGLASFRFSSSGEAVAAAITHVEPDERLFETFRRRVLPVAVQVRGREVLHASGIRAPSGVITFCGITQSGKSTIAFGLSERGYSLWADDMVAFEFSEGQAMAVSLPFRPRLRKPSAEFFAVENVPPLDAAPPGTHRAPLAIVCILRKEPEAKVPVSLRRLSSTDAFAAALDHACCFIPLAEERKRLMVQHYLELVAVTPIYEICFRPGLTNLRVILDAVEELLDSTAK
jgi:hypothetical protein